MSDERRGVVAGWRAAGRLIPSRSSRVRDALYLPHWLPWPRPAAAQITMALARPLPSRPPPTPHVRHHADQADRLTRRPARSAGYEHRLEGGLPMARGASRPGPAERRRRGRPRTSDTPPSSSSTPRPTTICWSTIGRDLGQQGRPGRLIPPPPTAICRARTRSGLAPSSDAPGKDAVSPEPFDRGLTRRLARSCVAAETQSRLGDEPTRGLPRP